MNETLINIIFFILGIAISVLTIFIINNFRKSKEKIISSIMKDINDLVKLEIQNAHKFPKPKLYQGFEDTLDKYIKEQVVDSITPQPDKADPVIQVKSSKKKKVLNY